MTQPTPICALGWMTAVASIMRNSSRVDEHERHVGFTDGFLAHVTDALGLADLAAHLGQLDLDSQRVARQDGLAPSDAFRGHEVGDLPAVLDLLEHENAGDLC